MIHQKGYAHVPQHKLTKRDTPSGLQCRYKVSGRKVDHNLSASVSCAIESMSFFPNQSWLAILAWAPSHSCRKAAVDQHWTRSSS